MKYSTIMQPPMISILTPFKNSSQFLTACLKSIINQTYSHWELLIVDDHSTDDSYALVASFAQKDKRIKLLKNTGKGIIDALNLAFKNSSGQLITRMDSDDIMGSDKLKIMSEDLKTHGKGFLALGMVNYFHEGTLGEGYSNYEKWLNNLTKTGTNYTEIYKECVIPSPCWMIHRQDLVVCGAFDHTTYPEDYDLAFRFYKHGLKCIPSGHVLHHWRDYDTRTSRTDENYADNRFLKLKMNYFMELDYDFSRPLVLWGAGFKGKFSAKLLKKNKVPFIWICNNPKKIGKHIYTIELDSIASLSELIAPQVIITVANKTAQKKIRNILENQQLVKAHDYFFFC
ncbi:MAG: glycosyltransferase [Gelidibacter sp.]